MILTDKKERGRFLRFAVVGIIGAVVDFGIFNLLIVLTGLASVWASAISFSAAIVSNFFWNRFWTYPDSRSKKVSTQLLQFIVVSVVGLGIRVLIFNFLEPPLIHQITLMLPAHFFLKPSFIGHNGTLAFSVLIVMMWNFIANRYWTYSDVG